MSRGTRDKVSAWPWDGWAVVKQSPSAPNQPLYLSPDAEVRTQQTPSLFCQLLPFGSARTGCWRATGASLSASRSSCSGEGRPSDMSQPWLSRPCAAELNSVCSSPAHSALPHGLQRPGRRLLSKLWALVTPPFPLVLQPRSGRGFLLSLSPGHLRILFVHLQFCN